MQPPVSDDDLKRIMTLIKDRGFSVDAYKPDFLKRRIYARMISTRSPAASDYLLFLKKNADEAVTLLDNCSINVSEFFRDPPVWTKVTELIAEKVREKTGAGNRCSIRIWSAACSCGEEPYTIAMAVKEASRRMPFITIDARIHATDVDKDAIKKGVEGRYRECSVKSIPAELRERYLKREGDFYSVVEPLRQMVKFREHNIIEDPPLMYFDFIFCRNLLIYFSLNAQKRVIENFCTSLFKGGFLVLGMNEAVPTGISCLKPLDTKSRIYVKV
ncbi:MAG: protein-glutamate O-methyltransferase CheR [Candidatus Methanosuratincola sp.]